MILSMVCENRNPTKFARCFFCRNFFYYRMKLQIFKYDIHLFPHKYIEYMVMKLDEGILTMIHFYVNVSRESNTILSSWVTNVKYIDPYCPTQIYKLLTLVNLEQIWITITLF